MGQESKRELRKLPMVSALATFVLCLQHETQLIPMPSQAYMEKRRELRGRDAYGLSGEGETRELCVHLG
jgi:hypothetical protein